jgi:hypothetical protein
VLLISGMQLLDVSAVAKLPWGGLAPPESTPPQYAAAQQDQASPGVTRVGPDQGRVDRGVRPAIASPTAAPPVLSLRGSFPSSGSGSFVYANSRGPILGTAGTLRRFHVGVEKDIVAAGSAEVSGADPTAFASTVDVSLGDRRSWTASGRLRLQRVPPGERSDFTIYLATPETARKMCAQGSVDIVVKGEPYTSCRAPGKVILNLARWRLSVPDYVAARVPLEIYRQYLINHEVGHELGHGHELCPGKGRPAPVMQQQTLGLTGCVANAWPYLNGRRYAGRPGSADS